MKKPFNTIILLLTLAMFSTGSMAQTSYSLQGLIDKVLTENYQVKIVRNQEQMAINNNTLGNAGFLPDVSIQGSTSVSVNNRREESTNGDVNESDNNKTTSLNALASVNWTVFDGFRMFARRDKLGYLQEIGVLETKYLIEQTIADVATLYYRLVTEQQRLANTQKAMQVSAFRLKLERKKNEVGSGNALRFNQALVDYQTDSMDVIRQHQVIQSLEISLNQIINQNPLQRIVPTDETIPRSKVENLEQLIPKSLKTNYNLQIDRLQELIAETDLKSAQANRYPSINLFGQYSYTSQNYNTGTTQSAQFMGPQAGVQVRMNLFNGGNINREVRNARLSAANASLNNASTTRIIESLVTDRYLKFTTLNQLLSIAQSNVEAAEKSLTVATMQLEQGSIDGYNFRLTQLSVINARHAVTEIEYSLKTTEIELNRLCGELAGSYL
jgi:outer membrane protein TolC